MLELKTGGCMKKKITIALIISFFLISISGFFIYKRYFTKTGIKIIETAKVQRKDIREVLVETGIIKPQVDAVIKVGARATGTIIKMNVKVGDSVKKGQLIALIDDREILDTIAQTEASLEAARESLRQAESTYPKRIDEARANYEYAKKEYERQLGLIEKGFTTKETFERAKKDLDSSEAIYLRLKDEFESSIKIARANIKDKEASLKQQKTRLSYTRIYAPIDGLVSEVNARDGETIVAGLQVANLITIIDPKRLEMWIYVDETDIGKIRVGHPVEFSVDTFPEMTFKGKIENIYPQPIVKENIVYYLATLKLPPEDASYLRPEMTTHVKIISEEKKDVLSVPNASVKYEAGRQVVYRIIGKEKVEPVEVKTGIVGEDYTEIVSGLRESDIVAVKLLLPPKNGKK